MLITPSTVFAKEISPFVSSSLGLDDAFLEILIKESRLHVLRSSSTGKNFLAALV